MTDIPPVLSRFAADNPKPRPTHTVIVPGRPLLDQILSALVTSAEVFTVEPSPTADDVWHVGCFESALPIVNFIATNQEPE